MSAELGPIPQHSSSIQWNNLLVCFRSKLLTPVAFAILVASTIYVDIQHYNYDCKGVNLKLELVVGV